jgi:hypothetical protein
LDDEATRERYAVSSRVPALFMAAVIPTSRSQLASLIMTPFAAKRLAQYRSWPLRDKLRDPFGVRVSSDDFCDVPDRCRVGLALPPQGRSSHCASCPRCYAPVALAT